MKPWHKESMSRDTGAWYIDRAQLLYVKITLSKIPSFKDVERGWRDGSVGKARAVQVWETASNKVGEKTDTWSYPLTYTHQGTCVPMLTLDHAYTCPHIIHRKKKHWRDGMITKILIQQSIVPNLENENGTQERTFSRSSSTKSLLNTNSWTRIKHLRINFIMENVS